MLFAISSNSYDRDFRSGRIELLDWMSICARELRVHGIEIAARHMQSSDEDYVKSVRSIAVDLQLQIAAFSVDCDFGIEEEAAVEKELEAVERALETAQELGVSILRLRAGTPGEDKKQAWDGLVRCMQIACLLAERDGIVIALENDGPGGFIKNSGDVNRIMADTDSEWLRLGLSTAAFAADFESIEKSLIYNVIVRAALGDIEADGHDPSFDYPALLALLHESNYRGFLSLDYSGAEPSETAVPRALTHLRALAAKL